MKNGLKFRISIQIWQLHNLTNYLLFGHHPLLRSLEQQWVALSRKRRQRLRQGVIYSGWRSSLIVSDGMTWPQHNTAKCGSTKGQDSYLVPMLSYLPCAILDILCDLCTQRCTHPLLPSEAWVMWKAREARELPNWPFQHPWSWTAPYEPCGMRKREGGLSGSEFCFLDWQSYTKSLLSVISFMYCIFISVLQTLIPGLARQIYIVPQSDC